MQGGDKEFSKLDTLHCSVCVVTYLIYINTSLPQCCRKHVRLMPSWWKYEGRSHNTHLIISTLFYLFKGMEKFQMSYYKKISNKIVIWFWYVIEILFYFEKIGKIYSSRVFPF